MNIEFIIFFLSTVEIRMCFDCVEHLLWYSKNINWKCSKTLFKINIMSLLENRRVGSCLSILYPPQQHRFVLPFKQQNFLVPCISVRSIPTFYYNQARTNLMLKSLACTTLVVMFARYLLFSPGIVKLQ